MSHRYRGVMFDLLTALLDSWSLWNRVAGSDALGLAWRRKYLHLTYHTGRYRSYERIIKDAATDAGVPVDRVDELVARWGELTPWPEAPHVLQTLGRDLPLAVITNASIALADIAVRCLGVPIAAVITAEEAGYYKPHARPYQLGLDKLGLPAADVLFVAGSAADVPGAMGVGMPVFWHNRMHLPAADARVAALHVGESLSPLLELA